MPLQEVVATTGAVSTVFSQAERISRATPAHRSPHGHPLSRPTQRTANVKFGPDTRRDHGTSAPIQAYNDLSELKGDEQIRNGVGLGMAIGRHLTLTRHGTSEGCAYLQRCHVEAPRLPYRAVDESVSGEFLDVDESPNQVFNQPTL